MTKGHKFNKQYLPYGSTPDSDLLHFIMSHDTLTNKIGLSKIGVIHAKSCVHLAWNVPHAQLKTTIAKKNSMSIFKITDKDLLLPMPPVQHYT